MNFDQFYQGFLIDQIANVLEIRTQTCIMIGFVLIIIGIIIVGIVIIRWAPFFGIFIGILNMGKRVASENGQSYGQ